MERKRAREERDLIHRYKVFAKLQTAQDFEVLTEGLIGEFLFSARTSAQIMPRS